jgi:hypothetical protein
LWDELAYRCPGCSESDKNCDGENVGLHFKNFKIKVVSVTPRGTASPMRIVKYRTPQRPVSGNIGARQNNPRRETTSRIAARGTDLVFCLIII